jgi:predicted RNase H-like HicB family nuclease
MNLTIEIEQEENGRWIAEVPNLPGVLAYGNTREEKKNELIQDLDELCRMVTANGSTH